MSVELNKTCGRPRRREADGVNVAYPPVRAAESYELTVRSCRGGTHGDRDYTPGARGGRRHRARLRVRRTDRSSADVRRAIARWLPQAQSLAPASETQSIPFPRAIPRALVPSASPAADRTSSTIRAWGRRRSGGSSSPLDAAPGKQPARRAGSRIPVYRPRATRDGISCSSFRTVTSSKPAIVM